MSSILPGDSKQQGYYLKSNHKLKINCVDYDKQNKEFVFEKLSNIYRSFNEF